MSESAWVMNVDEIDFQAQVIDRSRSVPVLVDFWAEWCQPCRMLGPLLEKLAREYDGRFVLAKVDTDRNPNAAMEFQVQGIPAVYLLVNGAIAGSFSGFQPESALRTFLDRLLPSEADRIAERARTFEVQDPIGARRMYEQALALEPNHGPSCAHLAGLLLDAGEFAEAKSWAEKVARHGPGWDRAEQVLSRLEVKQRVIGSASLSDLEAHCARNPGDFHARMELGSGYASVDRHEEALETWIAIAEENRDFGSEHVRPLMVALFRALGNEHPLVDRYRPRLASAIY